MSDQVTLEGLHIFPCRFDKRPAIGGGFKSATNDPAVIDLWRKRYFLMAAPTGAGNGFDVLDVDPGGQDWLATYEATHGLPATRIHATRRGGLHIFFQHRPGLLNRADYFPKVDVRTEGGYCIWWPLAGCRALSNAPIAPWPEPMFELLHKVLKSRSHTAPLNHVSPVTTVYQGDRFVPDQLHRKIIELMRGAFPRHQRRVRGALRPLVWAREGRNDKLFSAAGQFRDLIDEGIIDRASAEELLFMAAEMNGYVAKRGNDWTWSTIRSGLKLPGIRVVGWDEKEEGSE